ncbi:hypothetical protein N7462_007579 [Penicillium macrosclerotiorum]|uniref:uncharacterized protein n=1 Tax=Penicillium macrosclerotiorum TaxID=303699 RepID=UPI0025477513|nr:uncharacterized protein N7462_007579 [Penicillium macrosclerotiorum]KAJ5679335.1 hypothetical protein N7462_007579 [Penicillium macrosclerotiorum]
MQKEREDAVMSCNNNPDPPMRFSFTPNYGTKSWFSSVQNDDGSVESVLTFPRLSGLSGASASTSVQQFNSTAVIADATSPQAYGETSTEDSSIDGMTWEFSEPMNR